LFYQHLRSVPTENRSLPDPLNITSIPLYGFLPWNFSFRGKKGDYTPNLTESPKFCDHVVVSSNWAFCAAPFAVTKPTANGGVVRHRLSLTDASALAGFSFIWWAIMA
jgi:hypothetical protein